MLFEAVSVPAGASRDQLPLLPRCGENRMDTSELVSGEAALPPRTGTTETEIPWAKSHLDRAPTPPAPPLPPLPPRPPWPPEPLWKEAGEAGAGMVSVTVKVSVWPGAGSVRIMAFPGPLKMVAAPAPTSGMTTAATIRVLITHDSRSNVEIRCFLMMFSFDGARGSVTGGSSIVDRKSSDPDPDPSPPLIAFSRQASRPSDQTQRALAFRGLPLLWTLINSRSAASSSNSTTAARTLSGISGPRATTPNIETLRPWRRRTHAVMIST